MKKIILVFSLLIFFVPIFVNANEEISFVDVSKDDWFYESVKEAYNRGIIAGYPGNRFGPNDKVTRGQIVTFLYRMEGEPTVSGTSKFSDVVEGEYYADPVKWASDNHIVNGLGSSGKFGPNNPIIRQDLACILNNYAKYKGYTYLEEWDLSGFVDYDLVKDGYAEPALKWAVKNHIISGKGAANGKRAIAPFSNTTRAEAAAMIVNFINTFINVSGNDDEEYTITYHLDGGINNENNVSSYTKNDSVVLYEPTKQTYKFRGWYTDPNLTKKIEGIDEGSTGNIDLYAKWTEVYSVKFIRDSYTGDMGIMVNDEFTLELYADTCDIPIPTKSGYVFNGWKITENGVVNNYFFYDCSQITPNFVVSADWHRRDKMSILYHLNGGINDSRNIYKIGFGQTAELYAPTKDGFAFLGWYTEPEFINQVTTVTYSRSYDVNLYAKWEEQ